jgi:hypothetical protein
VNYEKYRAMRCEEDRAEQNRRAQAAYRKRNQPASATGKQSQPPSAHAEVEATSLYLPKPRSNRTASGSQGESANGPRAASLGPSAAPPEATEPQPTKTPEETAAIFATLRASLDDPKPEPVIETPEQVQARKQAIIAKAKAVFEVQPQTTMPIPASP